MLTNRMTGHNTRMKYLRKELWTVEREDEEGEGQLDHSTHFCMILSVLKKVLKRTLEKSSAHD